MSEITIENNKRIARNSFFLYFRMIIVMAVALYTSRQVLSVLGDVDYGIYNVVGGIVLMFGFLNGALASSTSRFITVELGRKNYVGLQKIFSATIVNHVVIAILMFVLAETVGLWFVENKLVIPPERMDAAMFVYQFSVFSCMVTLVQTPYYAVIIAHERMNVYAWTGVVDSVLKLAVVYLIMIFAADKLKLYAFFMFLVITAVFLFYVFYAKKAFPYCKFRMQKDIGLYKTMICYSGWELFGNFSVVAQGQGLNILLNMFFGPAVNAARGIAYQVQGAVTQFSTNITTAVRPQIIKYYAQGDRQKMIKLVFDSTKISFYMVFMLALPVILETEYILGLWLKEVPEYTAVFTRIILAIVLVNSLRVPIIIAMHATGKNRLPNIVCGTLLILTLPISYLFLKQGYSPQSVFVISFVVIFITMWMEQLVIRINVKHSITQFVLKVFLVCLAVGIIGAIMPYMVFYNMQPSLMRLAVLTMTSFVSVSTVAYTIGIGKEARTMVNSKFKQMYSVIFKR